jgi:hypothetical protein
MTEAEIFDAALDLPDPAARAKYLDAACGGDAALRGQVEALLRSHEGAGSFLLRPAVAPPDPDSAATQEWSDETIADQGATPDETLTFLTPPGRPDSLGRIGHYEVLEVLGRGGFGIVLRAFDEVLHRVVAVKVLAPELAATSPARKRFLREARSSAQVRHENVVQVYAVEAQPLPYLVMEFIPGETLQQRLDRTGPLETSEVLEIGRQIAEGLAAAHEMGLIHRDVKPGNILLEAGSHPRVKITDFGLARTADDASLTQSGLIAGTPMFMSPDQAKGERIDHRADLFSLGSVLYTMCSGRPPFRSNRSLAVLKRVAEDTPRPISEIIPEVPPWLCDIISRLHAKTPDDRFDSARDVADLLARCLAEIQRQGQVQAMVGVTPPEPKKTSAAAPSRRPGRRAALLLLASLVGLGFTEANGVTDLHGTVIRLFFPEGTLVVEVDDPGVRVSIDGEDLIITGAGVQEIRMRTGRHTFQATKDGKVLLRELVTVTTHGRRVVRVRREAEPQPDAREGSESGVAVIGEGPVRTVAARLKEINPAFHGEIRSDRIDHLRIVGSGMRDISPVRAWPQLQYLNCMVKTLEDLSPLTGMHLGDLSIQGSVVSDLRPLKGMELSHFVCTATPVSDLWPLRGMPLRDVQIAYTAVADLSPLKGMNLQTLNCDGCKGVSDLSPLKGMPLTRLHLRDTRVSDLSPLRGMRLIHLDYTNALVTDIAPLGAMPLKEVRCDFQPGRDAAILRSIRSLETINGQPAAEFWKDVDKAVRSSHTTP